MQETKNKYVWTQHLVENFMDVKMNDMFMKSINYNKFCGLKLTVILPLIMSVFRGLGVA